MSNFKIFMERSILLYRIQKLFNISQNQRSEDRLTDVKKNLKVFNLRPIRLIRILD